MDRHGGDGGDGGSFLVAGAEVQKCITAQHRDDANLQPRCITCIERQTDRHLFNVLKRIASHNLY